MSEHDFFRTPPELTRAFLHRWIPTLPTVPRSDHSEYAWFVWKQGRRSKHTRLELL